MVNTSMFSRSIYRLKIFLKELRWLVEGYFREAVKSYRLWQQLAKTPKGNVGQVHSDDLEIISMVSHFDLPLLLISLKTFLFTANQAFTLTILDDGSLLPSDIKAIKKHLDNVKVITRKEADELISKNYKRYKFYLKYREKEAMVRKALDIPLLASKPRVLAFDSDILFFHKPTYLLKVMNDKKIKAAFISDTTSAYTISDIEAKHHFGLNLVPNLNGGLTYCTRDMIDLDLVEDFLAFIESKTVLRRLFMQTYFSLIFSRLKKDELGRLPAKDYVLNYDTVTKENIVARHYVGTPAHVRELFFRDAPRALAPLLK